MEDEQCRQQHHVDRQQRSTKRAHSRWLRLLDQRLIKTTAAPRIAIKRKASKGEGVPETTASGGPAWARKAATAADGNIRRSIPGLKPFTNPRGKNGCPEYPRSRRPGERLATDSGCSNASRPPHGPTSRVIARWPRAHQTLPPFLDRLHDPVRPGAIGPEIGRAHV